MMLTTLDVAKRRLVARLPSTAIATKHAKMAYWGNQMK